MKQLASKCVRNVFYSAITKYCLRETHVMAVYVPSKFQEILQICVRNFDSTPEINRVRVTFTKFYSDSIYCQS